MGLVTWFKRLLSGGGLQKPPPHKMVRTKAQTAQKRQSEIAAKQGARTKIKPAPKFGSKRAK